MKAKKIGKIGLLDMLRPSLLFMGKWSQICEEWQKKG
jgi:hypothetical protein